MVNSRTGSRNANFDSGDGCGRKRHEFKYCCLQLFNLRKEVDALSAWLATLRAQAGSVALTRRISGAYAAAPQDGHHETSPAEERYGSHITDYGSPLPHPTLLWLSY